MVVAAVVEVVSTLTFVDSLFGLIVPLGLSFTVFRAVDLLVKVKDRTA